MADNVRCVSKICNWYGRRVHSSVRCDCYDMCSHSAWGQCPKCGAGAYPTATVRQWWRADYAARDARQAHGEGGRVMGETVWEDAEGHAVTLSYAVHVLNRFRRMVHKQDYWRGYFNEEESDQRIHLALMRAIECIQNDPRYLGDDQAHGEGGE